MPENHEVAQQRPKADLVSESQNTLSVMLQKVVGEGSFTPNEKQVDEILSQRGRVYDYIHADKKQNSFDNRFYFAGALLASLIIVVLVLFFAKEFLTQVISLIIGAFGGYGIGRAQKS